MTKTMLLICLSASVNCACSLIFVQGPPSSVERLPPSESVECTSGKAAPIIDTLVAGYQVFRTSYALSHSEADYNGAPISRSADIGMGVGFTALFAASALYGYGVTSECSEAKERHRRLQRKFDSESNAQATSPTVFTFSPRRTQSGNANPAPATGPWSSVRAPAPPPSSVQVPAPPPSGQPAPSAAPEPEDMELESAPQ
jgi:hypothetical protein